MRKLYLVASLAALFALTACGDLPGDTSVPADTEQPVVGGGDDGGTATGGGSKVLLDLHGSGIKRSKKFTTAGDWTIHYTYDCRNFGYKGNFQIYVEGDTMDVAVNELGKKGSGVQNEYDSGRMYLEMNSECDWHVVVKG